MMKYAKRKLRIYYLIVLISLCFTSYSQQVVNSAGQSAVNENGSISQSIGLSLYQSASSESGQIAEGILYFYQIEEIPTSNKDKIQLNILAFPNPVTNELQIRYDGEILVPLTFRVSDLNGRLLNTVQTKEENSTISFGQLADGIYLLQVYSDSKILKSLKIIKK